MVWLRDCVAGQVARLKRQLLEGITDVARLLLKFDKAVLQEVPVSGGPVTIGRALDNDIRIDNLAVSNYHARVYAEAGNLMVEDLESLNGTFVNDQRVKCTALRDGDAITIGKHQIIIDEMHEAAGLQLDSGRKIGMLLVDETVVLDTKKRRTLLQQAGASGERSQLAPGRVRVATLAVLGGKTNQKEYLLSSKLTVIGKSEMATVRLRGWFAPQVAAQINRRGDAYYLGRGSHVPRLNGELIIGTTVLGHGDLIEVARVRLRFMYRD